MRPTASINRLRRGLVRPALWLLLVAAAACDRADTLSYDTPFRPGGSASAEQVSIAYLRSLCTGGRVTVTRPLMAEARVTANDAYGEWYRSLMIEDATGGIEVLLDAAQLSRRYPVGTLLHLFCEGLELNDYGGMIRIGAPVTSADDPGRIAGSDFDRHLRVVDAVPEPLLPAERTLTACTPEQAGRFVRLHDVAFDPDEQGLPWCDRDPASGAQQSTTRHLCDAAGNRLAVYTLWSCRYGTEPLPAGRGTVCGILTRFGGTLQLRVVNRDFLFAEPSPEP